MHRPQLWVIAGPNGSGKTTLTQRYLVNKVPIVNPDEIAKELNPENPNERAIVIKAGRLAAQQRQEYLKQKKHFAFETTFSGKGELALMKQAADAGFKVNFVFVATESPMISIGRIIQRVDNGGHFVPAEDIVRRYERSLANLPKGLEIAERIFILDNTRSRHRLLLSRENNKVKTLSRSLPQWLKKVDLGFELKKGLQRDEHC